MGAKVIEVDRGAWLGAFWDELAAGIPSLRRLDGEQAAAGAWNVRLDWEAEAGRGTVVIERARRLRPVGPNTAERFPVFGERSPRSEAREIAQTLTMLDPGLLF